MCKTMDIESLRNHLERFIDTTSLTDTQVVQILEKESLNVCSLMHKSSYFMQPYSNHQDWKACQNSNV